MKYLSVSEYLKGIYNTKVYRLSLSTGCTCPNRDGTCGTGGCSFCSEGGSGDFAETEPDIGRQIQKAMLRVESKMPKSIPQEKRRYIAYFQSFTNTYGSVSRLEKLFMQAIMHPGIVILSVATRPDCLGDDVMEMLCRLNRIKPVWVELGLQTIHQKTADSFYRGYTLETFTNAYKKLKQAGLTVIVHVILGLPGESTAMMLETISFLGRLQPVLDGIKIQQLHVLKGTRLALEYEKKPFALPTLEEYCSLLTKCLPLLNPGTIIHRLTGDGPKKLLIAPLWTADKKRVLNAIKKTLGEASETNELSEKPELSENE